MCYVIIPLTDSTNPPSRSKRHRIREGRSQKITRIRSMWRPTPFSFCSRPLREILRLLYYNLTAFIPPHLFQPQRTSSPPPFILNRSPRRTIVQSLPHSLAILINTNIIACLLLFLRGSPQMSRRRRRTAE